MHRVLVIGGYGMIGSLVSVHGVHRTTTGRKRSNNSPECQLLDFESMTEDSELSELLRNYETIVFCSGKAHSNETASIDYYKRNYLDVKTVLENCTHSNTKKFIYISSGHAFLEEESPTNAITSYDITYAQSKIMGESLVREMCGNKGITYVILRLPTVIGKNLRGPFYLLKKAANYGLFFHFPAQMQLRHFIHHSDVSKVFDLVINTKLFDSRIVYPHYPKAFHINEVSRELRLKSRSMLKISLPTFEWLIRIARFLLIRNFIQSERLGNLLRSWDGMYRNLMPQQSTEVESINRISYKHPFGNE